jgi:hypothetical protein
LLRLKAKMALWRTAVSLDQFPVADATKSRYAQWLGNVNSEIHLLRLKAKIALWRTAVSLAQLSVADATKSRYAQWLGNVNLRNPICCASKRRSRCGALQFPSPSFLSQVRQKVGTRSGWAM